MNENICQHHIAVPALNEPQSAELRALAGRLSTRTRAAKSALEKIDNKAAAEHEELSTRRDELKAKFFTTEDSRYPRMAQPLDARMAELELRLDDSREQLEKALTPLVETSAEAYELYCRSAYQPAQAELLSRIHVALAPFVASQERREAIARESQAFDALNGMFRRFDYTASVSAEYRIAFAHELVSKIEALLAGTLTLEFEAKEPPVRALDRGVSSLQEAEA